jgi:flavorubredoxin
MKALVLFHSQECGNTAAMAAAVAEGLRSGGSDVTLFNTNDGRFDVVKLAQYDCVAFGSPDYYSYIAGGLKVFLDDYHIASSLKGVPGLTDKPYALFYSHGGGGAVRGPMENLFGRIGTKVGATIESSGKPSQAVLAKCVALGKELAAAGKRAAGGR